MYKKVVATSVLLASLASVSVVNADSYRDREIACATDEVFSQNSCNQCFDGGVRAEGEAIGGLSDLWVNNTGADRILYEEFNIGDNTNPVVMIPLNSSVWEENKVADKFWKLTDDMKKLYDADNAGYILKNGQSVNWIESTEGSSYVLKKNNAKKGENTGLLVYEINDAPFLNGGEMAETSSHRECVLFKSGNKTTPPKNEKPRELPKTGPEHYIILLLMAMFLAFGVLRFKKS